jgi:outer membrane protein assembly factor BamA
MKSLPLGVAVILLLASTACNNMSSQTPAPQPKIFSEADVTKAQEEITHEYQNRGFDVEQVALIKDSDRHLSGYAKIRKASGFIRPQLTKKCTATMDQDSGKYIYGCQ